MYSGNESLAVFDKTVKPMPKLWANIMIGGALLFIILGTPTAIIMNSWHAGISTFVIGVGLLLYALLMRVATIVKICSDETNLVLHWSNGRTGTIPWSDIADVKLLQSGGMAEDLFLNVWTTERRTLWIKRHKGRSISISNKFAQDRAFVNNLKNHPMLHRNRET